MKRCTVCNNKVRRGGAQALFIPNIGNRTRYLLCAACFSLLKLGDAESKAIVRMAELAILPADGRA
jgi:hypothetical protein